MGFRSSMWAGALYLAPYPPTIQRYPCSSWAQAKDGDIETTGGLTSD